MTYVLYNTNLYKVGRSLIFMTIEYDEQVFEQIPDALARELREFEKENGVNYTNLWEYSLVRPGVDQPFDEFKEMVEKGHGIYDQVSTAFRIPPIKSAPVSERVFVAGFDLPTGFELESLLRERRICEGLGVSQVRRLRFLWRTFFDSKGEYFLDDPSITLPIKIVHGKTMKGHDGIGTTHFEISDLMHGLGRKYSIPVYTLDEELEVAPIS
jgi:hypothetical protein